MKKRFLSLLLTAIFILGATPALAAPSPAIPVNNEDCNLIYRIDPDQPAYVAELTLFSTADASGSSGSNISGHAWITVKNISNQNIQVGLHTGIAPGKMESLGTYGNKNEHTGLWYNLESYFYANNGYYHNSYTLKMGLTAPQLNTLNSYIAYHDSWSYTNNCSTFASGAWNSVAIPGNTVSAGTVNTPSNLISSIRSKSGYGTNNTMSYNYNVCYANGTSAPIQSSVYR